MNKKLAAIIIIIFVVVIYYTSTFYVIFTGFIPAVSVSVSPLTAMEINLNHPSAIDYGEQIDILAETHNIGSVDVIDQRINVRIKDTNLTDLATYFDAFATLKPGERRGFKIKYLPNMTGFHWVRAEVNFQGQKETEWGLFYVRPPSPIYIVIPDEPTIFRKETIRQTGPAITDLEIEYQDNIVMLRGQSYITSIVLRNVGNTVIGDITTETVYMLPVVDLMPRYVGTLYKQSSSVLLLHLTVPKEFPLGSYPIDININIGNSTNKTRTITINLEVRESDLRNETYRMLSNYMFISRIVEREMLLASINGKDISTVSEFLESAKEGLSDAVELFNKEMYIETKDKLLSEVKPNLESAILELAKLNIPLTIVLPGFLPYLLLLLVLILIPLMIILFWRFRKKREI